MTLSIVTGAARGIGLALCKELKSRGHTVIGTCRTPSPALEALGIEVVSNVDVRDDSGAEKLARAVGDRKVAVLINNAGILNFGDSLSEPGYESILDQFQVNAVGPLRFTSRLRKNLAQGSKVAFITSRMGSIADNASGGHYGYRMSKAALNMAAMSVARDLAPEGVAVIVLHPGMVKTDMIAPHGLVEPDEAARGLVERIDELTLATSGTFRHANGEALPW